MQCVAQRESITFFMDVFKNKVDESLDILSESVLNASLSEEEIDNGKADLQFQRETLPPEFLSKDVSTGLLGVISYDSLINNVLIDACGFTGRCDGGLPRAATGEQPLLP